MKDVRVDKLARQLIRYSTRLKAGENVLIEAFDVAPDIVAALVREARAVGAHPIVMLKTNQILRAQYTHAGEETFSLAGKLEKQWMEQMQAYIGIRGSLNVTELADVPAAQMALFQKLWWQPVHRDVRISHTKWVVLRYPSPSMAQLAGMSTDAFESFYFDVCANLDYAKMSEAMDPLKALMEKSDRVQLKGPGTDLTFSIKGIPAIKCDGLVNIPDGEVFTAPVKTSVNGTISFNTPTVYNGSPFDNMRLEFKDGKIVKATSTDTEKMNAILDTDPGGRYVGEFAIGFNPYITKPMKDILFDEKIAGSLHFTPGNSYDEADNGNKSGVHWDMVLMQDAASGGGEIWFDGRLIRKDGLFVLPELMGLNPENLKG